MMLDVSQATLHPCHSKSFQASIIFLSFFLKPAERIRYKE